MKPKFLFGLAALVLAIALTPGFSQEPSSPKEPAPPEASAPQTTATPPANPQNATSANQSQSPTPTPTKEGQSGPKRDESQAPQEPAPKKKTTAKLKSTARTTQAKKSKKATAAHSNSPQPNTTGASSGEPGKVVVRNGGARDDSVRLSPGASQEQDLHDRENTAQLLATTGENLKRISGRQLSPAQQGTLDQIHTYIRQAKSASDAGDLARAHTLAFKAHLLSDDLAKH